MAAIATLEEHLCLMNYTLSVPTSAKWALFHGRNVNELAPLTHGHLETGSGGDRRWQPSGLATGNK